MRLAAAILALCLASPAQAQIVSAEYADPTTRYAHGVLGDAIEWGTLELRLADRRVLRIVLPEARVFEDTAPRLADLDGDGAPEVIVVESSLTQGARLAVYDETGLLAATLFIGRRNRWLAPVGAADLDGDGRVEIAYVDRPHLARTLRVWRYDPVGPRLTEIASAEGHTNHRIGDRDILGGIRMCNGSPEMITASPDWSRLLATRLQGARLIWQDIGPNEAGAAGRALACR